MKLMTKEILKRIPPLYSTEDVDAKDKIIHVKIFTPWHKWTWYAVEYDPTDKQFFGYVKGDYDEWGYFSLKELEEIEGPMGLKIERDRYFPRQKMSVILNGKEV